MNSQADFVIFLGPPGAGKGSLSQICVRRLNWQQLSTGNLCRQQILEQTSIGKEIDFALKSGKLINDSLITSLVKDWLLAEIKTYKVIIFDGFPRTCAQAEEFSELIKNSVTGLVRMHIVKIDVPESLLVKRLLTRCICSNKKCQVVYSIGENSNFKSISQMCCSECGSVLVRRDDDNEEVIRQRLITYRKHENTLVDYYKKCGYEIHNLDGIVSLEQVYNQLINELDFVSL